MLVEDERGRRVAFVQIAGFLARRIVCYLEPGMTATRGARCGIIMFGSRVDTFLPPEAQPRVEVGARTRTKGSSMTDFAVAGRYQQAMGQHAILRLDLFGGLYEERDNGYGARVELVFKF